MIRDGRTLEAGAVLRTAVCVVGSGPAGLTVATELRRHGVEVVVVESGGEQPDEQIQDLARGTVVGDPLLDPAAVRHRRIGGNAPSWVIQMADGRTGVRYALPQAVDFERRDWVPNSGWPFALDELNTYYERAQRTIEAGPFAYDAPTWVRPGVAPWALDPKVAEQRVFQFGPSSAYTVTARRAVENDAGATLLHHATAVEVELDEAGAAARGVRCRHFDGREFVVEADTVVVATGGLGNARLLLQSDSRRPGGLGNGHDLLGRYLHDHPIVAGGSLRLSRAELWSHAAFYDMRLVDGASVMGHWATAAEAQREHSLLGLSTILFARPNLRRSRGLDNFKHLVEARGAGRMPPQWWKLAATVLAGADFLPVAFYRKLRWGQSMYPGFGRGGWAQMPALERKFVRFEVVHQAEQTPDPANRVLLGSDRDALGCRRLRVEWRFSADDLAAAARARRILAAELMRAGVGTVELPADDDGLGAAAGTAHHMGTTRMHDDPTRGVTNGNARLHDVPNVFVAGSSLFPTGGYANPTLTIVALAHRLADHIAARAGRG